MRPWTSTQGFEVKPDQATGLTARLNLTSFNVQYGIFILRLCQAIKGILHSGIRYRAQRHMVKLELFQSTAPVVSAVINIEHFKIFIQQNDSRKNAVSVHSIGIQLVWLEIRGGHETDTVIEQGYQQTMKNHRIRNVSHMKFIKANKAIFFGDTLGQFIQRIDRSLQTGQFAVNLTHKLMKMKTGFAFQRNCVEETIHQKTLAPPDAAKHVYTTRNIRTINQLLENVGSFSLEDRPLIGATFKCLYGPKLRWVSGIATGDQFSLISFFDTHELLQECYEINSYPRS